MLEAMPKNLYDAKLSDHSMHKSYLLKDSSNPFAVSTMRNIRKLQTLLVFEASL